MELNVKITKKGYDIKPSTEEMAYIVFNLKANDSTIIEYKELKRLIEEGHSFILAKYKKGCKTISEDDIEYIEAIALDVDSKINKITLYEMQSLIYQKIGIMPVLSYSTFSDTGELNKFRLIYRFKDPVTVEVFRKFYEGIAWKFRKYIDLATKNANRVWAGTNKPVNYTEKDIPITLPLIIKVINSYETAMKRKEKRVKVAQVKTYEKYIDDDYIKSEYKEQVIRLILDNISLEDFLIKKLGGNFKRIGSKLVGRCCIHNGDNKNALVITGNTYRCYTHCGTGNILTIAKKVYNIDNFSQVAFKLCEEYGIEIPREFIKRRG